VQKISTKRGQERDNVDSCTQMQCIEKHVNNLQILLIIQYKNNANLLDYCLQKTMLV